MGDVVIADIETKLDLPVERVLDGAKPHIKQCVVIGWEKTDDLPAEEQDLLTSQSLWISSSLADYCEVLFMLEKAKQAVLNMCEVRISQHD